MTSIPSNAVGTDARANLIRATLLMMSACSPDGAVVANTAKGTPAIPAVRGVAAYKKAFLATQQGDKVAISARLPLNSKIYGSYADIRKAIQPVPGTLAPTWAGPSETGTTTATTLEDWLYDSAVAVKAALTGGESLDIVVVYDATTGDSQLDISGAVTYALTSLAEGPSQSQS